MAVNPIPEGFHSVTPYLIVQDVPKLLDFLVQAFAAEEIHRMTKPDGSVMHAQVKIGDSMVMMGQASGDYNPMPSMLYLYVEDVDSTYKQALQAGATVVREPRNEFYGDRSGGVKGPCGNEWWIATHVEDVPPDDLAQREADYVSQ